MATSGIDRKLKIWDLRMYKEVQSCGIGVGAGALSFSQRGLLAAGLGNIVEVGNAIISLKNFEENYSRSSICMGLNLCTCFSKYAK